MAVIKKIFSILLRVAISVILLVFLFRQVDGRSILEVIKGINKPLLLLAFLFFFLTYILGLCRWVMLLKAVKINIPLKRVVTSFSGGVFFSLFLPSTIGGDFLRSVDLAVYTKKPKEVIATIFLDRLSGYIGLVILALIAMFLGWKILEDRSVVIALGIIIGMLAVVLLLLFNSFLYSKISRLLKSPNAGKIRDLITDLHEEIYLFRDKPKVVVKNILISIAVQAVPSFTFYIVALSLGLKISLAYFFIFLPIIGAITLLPISIGGLGLRDASTIFFFAKAGVEKNLAFAMSLLSFSFILFYGAIGGLIYVLTVHNRRLQCNQPSQVRKANPPEK
ncbi:MAG: lysylphosphatidylglycerol synthase transmembrane domain-containing protein [Candidatus Omnitrophota bacterium]